MYKSNIIAVLVLIFGALSQESVVRQPTIENPCESDPTSTGAQSYVDLREKINSTKTRAGTTFITCEDMKIKLKQALHASTVENLESNPVNVDGLPSADNGPNLTRANSVGQFMEEYRDISIYIMYLRNASTLAESIGRNWTTAIHTVQRAFYSWLCCVDTILRYSNSTVTTFVNSSVVTAEHPTYRLRYFYVLMMNAQTFINSKTRRYSTFLETLSD